MTTNLLAAIIVTLTCAACSQEPLPPNVQVIPVGDKFTFIETNEDWLVQAMASLNGAKTTRYDTRKAAEVGARQYLLVCRTIGNLHSLKAETDAAVKATIKPFFCVVTNFSTNVAEHWPQKQVENPHTGAPLYSLTDGSLWHEDHWGTHSENDTNADTKSVEFTVTARRLLSFEFERQRIEHELTNRTEAHYSVEMRRVRTNVDIVVYTNRIYTEQMVYPQPGRIGVLLSCPTNWFEPVATNQINQVFSFTNSVLFGTNWMICTNWTWK